MELRPVKFYFRPLGELFEIKRGINRAESKAVRFGDIVNLIGADQPGRAGDVLNDDVRVPWNVFRHEFRDETWIKVINVARFGSCNDRNRFPLIERSLSLDIQVAQ